MTDDAHRVRLAADPHRGGPTLFVDRDGTVIDDPGYISDPRQVRLIAGAARTLNRFRDAGYALVLVTNQSGIARGKFTEAQFETLTEWMDWSLADRGGPRSRWGLVLRRRPVPARAAGPPGRGGARLRRRGFTARRGG